MLTQEKIDSFKIFENSDQQKQLLETGCKNLVTVNQALINKSTFYEIFGFDADDLLIAGSFDAVSSAILKHANFVRYGHELSSQIQKIVIDVPDNGEDSVQMQQVRLAKQIVSKQMKSVRQEMANQLS